MLERLALAVVISLLCALQYHAGPEFPCAHTPQGESIPSRAPTGKRVLSESFEMPPSPVMVNTAFSPSAIPGEFARLPFMKTPLAKLGSWLHTQPSPGIPLSPSCSASWGRRPGCLYGRVTRHTCTQRDRHTCTQRDNFALCSLSSSTPFSPCPCGILGAVCGCLAPPAVEGEYCPWDRELLQGQWLQHLSKEEEMGTCEGTRFASCPPPPRLPSSHLKHASKSRPHVEGLFVKLFSKALGIPGYLSQARPPQTKHRLAVS